MLNMIRGYGWSPFTVGTLRALLEVGLMAAVGAVITQLGTLDWGQYVAFSPAIFAGLRALEGLIDEIDGGKRRANS